MKKCLVMWFFFIFLYGCAQTKPVSFSREPLKVKTDQHQWLEEVNSEKSLSWVRAQNQKTFEKLKNDPRYKKAQKEILKVYEDPEKIPYIEIKGEMVYNFWRDQNHVQGILRRTTFKEYVKKNPKWELLIDFDKLSQKEGKRWVYKGMECLRPEFLRCMIRMSDGGSDAAYSREYDFEKKQFISKDAFYIPESKHRLTWFDKDTLYLGYSFNENSLTDSGYPRETRIWKRGEPLGSAELIFEGQKSDVSVGSWRPDNPKLKYTVFYRGLDFYHTEHFVKFDDQKKMIQIKKPNSVTIEGHVPGHFLLRNREDWDGIPAGSLISLKESAVRSGNYKDAKRVVWSPDQSSSLENVYVLQSSVLLHIIRDVKGEAYKATLDEGKWSTEKLQLPANGTLYFMSESYKRDDLLLGFESFLTPESLYLLNTKNSEMMKLKSKKEYFDSSKYIVEQNWAQSTDGTKVPYFIVRSKEMKFNGKNPTYMYGYGGFEITLKPHYSAILGEQWLEKGGVFVYTNIRGGGEFGPRWHQAALKKNRQVAYDDFHSIAEDLIERKITSPENLAIGGGSNGGLLVGVAFTQRPDLYKAVACSVPLLDMMRFHKLLAGASWMGEYGNPEIEEEREAILRYSPYQNVHPDIDYPEVYFFTSTKDDRVHPGHARKMVARMKEQGHPVLYYENIEGGHGGAANLKQKATQGAMKYVYFWQKVMN